MTDERTSSSNRALADGLTQGGSSCRKTQAHRNVARGRCDASGLHRRNGSSFQRGRLQVADLQPGLLGCAAARMDSRRMGRRRGTDLQEVRRLCAPRPRERRGDAGHGVLRLDAEGRDQATARYAGARSGACKQLFDRHPARLGVHGAARQSPDRVPPERIPHRPVRVATASHRRPCTGEDRSRSSSTRTRQHRLRRRDS